jgi:hypothetical protein
MSEAVLYWCPQCGSCRHLPSRPTDERVRCLQCSVFSPHIGRTFCSVDWKATRDVFRMVAALPELKRDLTERKSRLFLCAIGRTIFDWCRNPWFRDALNSAEKWADTGEPPRGVEQCARQLYQMDMSERGIPDGEAVLLSYWNRRQLEQLGWVRIARLALQEEPRLRVGDIAPPNRDIAANLLRDLVPNPFSNFAWNPEWSTSTARDLTQHIYESREFSALPILADALQDAGCDSDLVLNHCRGNTPHARGCWILDAILDRT